MRSKRVFRITILSAAAFLAALLLLILTRSSYAFEPDPQTVWPPRNAVTATLNTTITLSYDEPISATTVTSHTFAVHGMQSGLVTGTHGVIEGPGGPGRRIIVTPTRPFHQGELVYAIATTRTRDITGTAPLSATQWQFNAGVVTNRCAGGFGEVHPGSLAGVHGGSVAWGDYDNDGDLDILLTGHTGSGYISKVYRNDDCPRIYLPLVLRGHESAVVLSHRSSGEATCNPPVSYGVGARTQAGRSQMQYALVHLAAVMGLAGSASFLDAGTDGEGVLLGACRRRAPP